MEGGIRPIQPERPHELQRLGQHRPRDPQRPPFELEDEPEPAPEEPRAEAPPAPPANDEGVGRRVDFTV